MYNLLITLLLCFVCDIKGLDFTKRKTGQDILISSISRWLKRYVCIEIDSKSIIAIYL